MILSKGTVFAYLFAFGLTLQPCIANFRILAVGNTPACSHWAGREIRSMQSRQLKNLSAWIQETRGLGIKILAFPCFETTQ